MLDLIYYLENELKSINLEINLQQKESLINYLFLLKKWNKIYNLTAITDIKKMITYHLVDSLAIVFDIKENEFLDIGTGAGLPGIPLAIIFPKKKFFLLDKSMKKTHFLNFVKIQLNIENINIINSTIEQHQNKLYQAILTRAFSSVENILEKSKKIVKKEGNIYIYKGKFSELEKKKLVEFLKNTDFELSTVKRFQFSDLENRCLLKLTKNK